MKRVWLRTRVRSAPANSRGGAVDAPTRTSTVAAATRGTDLEFHHTRPFALDVHVDAPTHELPPELEERTPEGCRITLTEMGASGAIRVPTSSPFLDAARGALADVFGKPPALIGCGGSIPVAGSMQRILGMDTLLVGFGLDDDRVHSPNEKFELACYRRGIESHVAMLAKFAGIKG